VLSFFRWKHLSVTLTGWFCLLSIGKGEGGFRNVEEAGIQTGGAGIIGFETECGSICG